MAVCHTTELISPFGRFNLIPIKYSTSSTFDPTQPGPTQPAGRPLPWTTLLQTSDSSQFFLSSEPAEQPLAVYSLKSKHLKTKIVDAKASSVDSNLERINISKNWSPNYLTKIEKSSSIDFFNGTFKRHPVKPESAEYCLFALKELDDADWKSGTVWERRWYEMFTMYVREIYRPCWSCLESTAGC